METDNSKESACPPLEDLSAWYDEELESEGMEQHIRECPYCYQCVEDFQNVDDSIAEVVQANDEQVHRIGRNCLQQISNKKSVESSYQPTPFWMKVAAGILVIGIIFFMSQSKEVVDSGGTEFVYNDDNSSPIRSEAIRMNSSANERYQEPIKPTFASSNPDSQSHSRINTQNNSVPFRLSNSPQNFSGSASTGTVADSSTSSTYQSDDITLIGFGRNGSYQSIKNSGINKNSDKFATPHKIRHVWKMDDPVVPLVFLKTLLLRQQDAFDQLISNNQDQYHLRFRVTEKNLQELVDHLDRMNCELLSPDFPQPGESSKSTGSLEKIFQYEVDFVKR